MLVQARRSKERHEKSDTKEKEQEKKWKDEERKEELVLIYQILEALERYSAVINPLVSQFYHEIKGEISRKDRGKISLLFLLFFVGLHSHDLSQCGDDQLSKPHSTSQLESLTARDQRALRELWISTELFEILLCYQVPEKMVLFLTWVTDETRLQAKVKETWMRFYEQSFVENIINSIAAKGDTYRKLLMKLNALCAVKQDLPRKVAKKTTTMAPFHLSETKPHKKTLKDSTAVPASALSNLKAKYDPMKLQSVTLESLRQAGEERLDRMRQQGLISLQKINEDCQFKFHETRNTTEKLREIKEEELEALRKHRFQAIRAPLREEIFDAEQLKDVTVSSLLREEAVVQKRRETEYQLLKDYEQNLRDDFEFCQWQAKMKGLDAQKKQLDLDNRKRESEAAFQKAKEAAKSSVATKQEIALCMKEKATAELDTLQAVNHDLVEQRRQQVLESSAVMKQKLAEAKEQMLCENVAIRRTIQKRKAKDKQRCVEQEQRMLEKKRDMIRSIRALEMKLEAKPKVFDPTLITSHGLLEELSYFEVKKRLELGLRMHAKQEQQKRMEINTAKQKKQLYLNEKLESVKQARRARRIHAERRRREKEANKQKARQRAITVNKGARKRIQQRLAEKDAHQIEQRKVEKQLRGDVKQKLEAIEQRNKLVRIKSEASLYQSMERLTLRRQAELHHDIENVEKLKASAEAQRRLVQEKEKENRRRPEVHEQHVIEPRE